MEAEVRGARPDGLTRRWIRRRVKSSGVAESLVRR